MILFTAQESSALPTLAETQAVAAEVHEDLQQLKPNAILESIKSWTPGLLSLAYRLFVAAPYYLHRFSDRLIHQPFSEKDL